MALVAAYEKLFGPSPILDQVARARMYQNIIDGIEREKARREVQAQRSKVVAAEKKKADAKLRAKNRAAKKKRDATRAKAEDSSGPAPQSTWKGELLPLRIRLSNGGSPAGQEERSECPEILESYRGTSVLRWCIRQGTRLGPKQLLAKFKKNLAVYKAKLADLQP